MVRRLRRGAAETEVNASFGFPEVVLTAPIAGFFVPPLCAKPVRPLQEVKMQQHRLMTGGAGHKI